MIAAALIVCLLHGAGENPYQSFHNEAKMIPADACKVEWLGNLVYVTTPQKGEASTSYVGKQAIVQKVTLDIVVGLDCTGAVVWRRASQ